MLTPQRATEGLWGAGAIALFATALMLVILGGVTGVPSLSLSSRDARPDERIAFVVPPAVQDQAAAPAAAMPARENGTSSGSGMPAYPRAGRMPASRPPQVDSTAARSPGAAPTPGSIGLPSRGDGRATAGDATALTLLGPRAASSITGRGAFPPKPVRDSIMQTLGASIPALARTRKSMPGEQDERWSAIAAANRQARNSGSPGPANPAQMGGVTLSLPLFSPGPSKRRRMRDSVTLAENRRIAARIQARLDSIVAVRRDSSLALAGDSQSFVRPARLP